MPFRACEWTRGEWTCDNVRREESRLRGAWAIQTEQVEREEKRAE